DLSGMKAYTYGGIRVYKDKFENDEEFEQTLEKIITVLGRYQLSDGTRVVEWIKKKEELYKGEYLYKYPELIFNLTDNYGAGWATSIPIFSESLAHKFYPGSHRATTPV